MPRERVALVGLSQESNSFTGLLTAMRHFAGSSGHLYAGEEVLGANRGTNTVIGGFVAVAEERGWEPVPVVDAYACPGGPLERAAYEELKARVLAGLRAAGPLDGVLVSLHGAMLAEGYDDPEGDLLAAVRGLVGDVPVVAVLDLHANVTHEMVAAASVLVAYKTYPHVDLAESGRRAAELLSRQLEGGERFHAALVPLPMLLPSINMRTIEGRGPMVDMQAEGKDLTGDGSRVVEVGVYGGFPFADVPVSRASVLVYAVSREEARAAALRVAARYWAERRRFLGATPPAHEALQAALAAPGRPVVIADVADNPASGGAGDTTTLLRLLVERDEPESFVGVIYDPETVARAFGVGVGGEARFRVGGKVNPELGAPVELRAEVLTLTDGGYVVRGPMLRGSRASIGRACLLRAGNVLVGVAEGRASVNDPAILETLGVDWRSLRLLALKVKGHFRAAFGGEVAAIFDAEAPGAAPTDLAGVPYRRVPRPVFPLDDVEWSPQDHRWGEEA